MRTMALGSAGACIACKCACSFVARIVVVVRVVFVAWCPVGIPSSSSFVSFFRSFVCHVFYLPRSHHGLHPSPSTSAVSFHVQMHVFRSMRLVFVSTSIRLFFSSSDPTSSISPPKSGVVDVWCLSFPCTLVRPPRTLAFLRHGLHAPCCTRATPPHHRPRFREWEVTGVGKGWQPNTTIQATTPLPQHHGVPTSHMHNENHGEQTRQTHGRRRYQCTIQTRKSDVGDVAKPTRRNAWERDAKEDARDGGKGARKIKWETHDPPCFETTLSQTKSLNVHASYTANPSCHRLANACGWPPSMHSEKTMGVGAMKRHNHGNVFGHCKLQQSIQLQRTFRNR